MKILTKRDRRSNLDKEIDSVLQAMANENPDTEEYEKAVKNLEILYKAKAAVKPNKVSKDVIVTVLGSIFCVVVTLTFEQTHILSTKAWSHIVKPRI